MNTEPPPCIGTNCVEVVFCTECRLDVSRIQSSVDEILVTYSDESEFSYIRLTEDSLETIHPSVRVLGYGLADGDLLGVMFAGEVPLDPLVFVRVDGDSGRATALVEFFHRQSQYIVSTHGRTVTRNDTYNNDNWSLCSISEFPGVSECLDYIPRPMDEVNTTVPDRPIDYGKDTLWRSRRYDGESGSAYQMWEEVNGDGPDGRYILSDDALFGLLSWLRPQGGIENHIYRYDLISDTMAEIGISERVGYILGASGETGQLVATGVDDINAPFTHHQVYRVDPVTGEETLLFELAPEDGLPRLQAAVLGDYLYFVRVKSPGCLERIRISP